MFRRNHTTHLPLLISGLPVFVIEWLEIAGIPTAPFQTTTLSRQGGKANGQILVFDARSASGRLDARIARESGAEIVNVADLLPRAGKPSQNDDATSDEQQASRLQAQRAPFFDELKLRVESAGGFWLRLADYPFPFQSALCRCLNPAEDQQAFAKRFAIESDDSESLHREPQPESEPLPRGTSPSNSGHRSANRETSAAWASEFYACGRPVFLGNTQPGPLAADSAPPNQPTETEADAFPLMWQTTGETFLNWCRVRSRLKLVAWKTGTTYRIQCTGDVAGFRPTIELWLGSHVASLPLVEHALTVREEGVLFVQEHRRHAAGLAAGWSVASGMSNIRECHAHLNA